MLKKRKIFQSNGIFKMLRISPRTIKADKPTPILIKFLSRKLSEFFTKKVAPKPKQKVYTKNSSMLMKAIIRAII